MAADEDEAKRTGTAEGARVQPDDKSADRRSGSRQRAPVTIDLTAEEIRAKNGVGRVGRKGATG